MGWFTSNKPDLSRLERQDWLVTITGTGRQIRLEEVDFTNGLFMYGAINVTAYLSPWQKRAFPAYDPSADLAAASDEHQIAIGGTADAVGSTSILGLFTDGVSEDLQAAKKNLPGLGQGVKQLLIAAAFVAVAYIAWQIVKAWKP